MSGADHDALVRRSFACQVPLFCGPGAPFARRAAGPLTWVEPLDPGMIVLDVACGAGHAAQQVASGVRQVVGIDLTTALLKLGADRVRDSSIGNVLLVEGNAERMPFLDESFDLVFCRSSLHHFAHPHQAVSEMVRVCRHDGRVVLLDIVPPDPAVRDAFDDLHRLLDPSHVRSFLESELADLLPGGLDGLTYADTFTFRLPVDVAMTDQSDRHKVLRQLRDELQGAAPPTGFEPTEEDGKVMVDFTTCVVHACRSGAPPSR